MENEFNVTLMVMLQVVPPYLPALFIWDHADIAKGKRIYHEALKKIAACKKSGVYKGFDSLADEDHSGIIELMQPNWNSDSE